MASFHFPGGYGGGYGPNFGGGYGQGGWQGGYGDYGSYGPPSNQGNPRKNICCLLLFVAFVCPLCEKRLSSSVLNIARIFLRICSSLKHCLFNSEA